MTKFHVVRFGENSDIITTVSNEDEAVAIFSTIHNIDRYDAEDGPRVAGYEADGLGCVIIDGDLA